MFLQVPVLLLLENSILREAADLVEQPWFKLYHFIASWRPDIDLSAWATSMKGLAAHPQGFERQLDAVSVLCPSHIAADSWHMLLEEHLRSQRRTGYQAEELLSSWVAAYTYIISKAAVHQEVAHAEPSAESSRAAEAAAAGVAMDQPQVPGLDEFLLQMTALEADPEAQLDTIATYKPAGMSQADWDRDVGKVSVDDMAAAT